MTLDYSIAGTVTVLLLIYLACFAPVALSARAGVRSVSQEQINAALSMGASPAQVAAQIAPFKELLGMRRELTQLLRRMEGNDKLEQLLADVLANTEKAKAVARVLNGSSGSAPQREEPQS